MSKQATHPADERPQGAEEELPERGDAYRVSLPMFEGPLDLLLHLIQKHELNILEIPIGFVAEKYVEYIALMEEMSIDLASEYLVMAATLVYLKSRQMLPADPHAAEDDSALEEEEDPRTELIRRLLEYQKYKHAAESLAERPLLGRDIFPRGAPADLSTDPAPLMPLSLFKLVDAFESVLKRAKRVVEHEVDFDRITITDKISQISELLKVNGVMRFEQLFEADVSRAEMIVTFLALLEMTKLRMTRLRQDGPLEAIFVELAVSDEEAGLLDPLEELSLGGEAFTVARRDVDDERDRELAALALSDPELAELGLSDALGLSDEPGLSDALDLSEELGLSDALDLSEELGLGDALDLSEALGLSDALDLGEALGLSELERLELGLTEADIDELERTEREGFVATEEELAVEVSPPDSPFAESPSATPAAPEPLDAEPDPASGTS